jgi:hypothetical protein
MRVIGGATKTRKLQRRTLSLRHWLNLTFQPCIYEDNFPRIRQLWWQWQIDIEGVLRFPRWLRRFFCKHEVAIKISKVRNWRNAWCDDCESYLLNVNPGGIIL